MKTYKWSFEGNTATFISSDETLAADSYKAAKMLKLAHETSIIIHGYTNDQPAVADDIHLDSDPAGDGESTVSVDNKKTKSRKKATDVSNVHGDVDSTTASPDLFLDSDSSSDSRFGSDSVADDAN